MCLELLFVYIAKIVDSCFTQNLRRWDDKWKLFYCKVKSDFFFFLDFIYFRGRVVCAKAAVGVEGESLKQSPH